MVSPLTDPAVVSAHHAGLGTVLGPGDTEGDWQGLKKWRKSSTDGYTPMNISHACAKSARVMTALATRCTMWMAYASNTSTKKGENGGTNPAIKNGRKMMTSPKSRGLG
jgi:hypothetical protein